nr:hypothetical protein [synthetic human alphaherpesvirus 1]
MRGASSWSPDSVESDAVSDSTSDSKAVSDSTSDSDERGRAGRLRLRVPRGGDRRAGRRAFTQGAKAPGEMSAIQKTSRRTTVAPPPPTSRKRSTQRSPPVASTRAFLLREGTNAGEPPPPPPRPPLLRPRVLPRRAGSGPRNGRRRSPRRGRSSCGKARTRVSPLLRPRVPPSSAPASPPPPPPRPPLLRPRVPPSSAHPRCLPVQKRRTGGFLSSEAPGVRPLCFVGGVGGSFPPASACPFPMRSRSRAGASRCRRRPLRRPSATPAPGPRAPQPLPSFVAGAVCGRRSRRAFMCAGETRPPPPGPAPGAGAESGTAPVLALRPNNIYILGRSANASRSHFFYPAAPPPWGGPARRPMGGRQGGRPLGRPPSRWSRRPAGGTGGPGTANGRAGLVSHYRRTGKSGPGPRPLPVPR